MMAHKTAAATTVVVAVAVAAAYGGIVASIKSSCWPCGLRWKRGEDGIG